MSSHWQERGFVNSRSFATAVWTDDGHRFFSFLLGQGLCLKTPEAHTEPCGLSRITHQPPVQETQTSTQTVSYSLLKSLIIMVAEKLNWSTKTSLHWKASVCLHSAFILSLKELTPWKSAVTSHVSWSDPVSPVVSRGLKYSECVRE